MNAVDFKTMTDDQLIERTEYLVRRERQLVECLIWHLQAIQDRRLYIQMGFTSLFECLVKHFKYSEAVAYSRISALKMINQVPEAAVALQSGEVNLTTLSLTQSFIRKQEKESGAKVGLEQKLRYLDSVKNKSTQEAKQILAAISPIKDLPADRVNYLDETHAQLQVKVLKATLDKIEKLKALISHQSLDPSYNEILDLALDAAIENIEKKRGLHLKPTTAKSPKSFCHSEAPSSVGQKSIARAPRRESTKRGLADKRTAGKMTQSFAIKKNRNNNSRYISRSVKRIVFARSNGQCEHIHRNGQRCFSKFQIQYDHVKAFSKGGTSSLDNIQQLCRVQNAYKGAD